MIFADKLIQLRKRAGWSQEELAEKMNVTRQSVSKWEGMQSVPDLEKILKLSQLFGVSTDFLLKDEIEETEYIDFKEETAIRKVSMEEANSFIKVKAETAPLIALATFLCIVSPICLFILGALSDHGVNEKLGGVIGMFVLITLVTIGVVLFIYSGSKSAPYEYLEKEAFETEYGVVGMVKERQQQFQSKFTQSIIVGVALCILGALPQIIGPAINDVDALFIASMLTITLVMVGIGVVFFIRNGVIWESYKKLLQEKEYTKENKAISSLVSAVATVYWLVATAIYLTYSFSTSNWSKSWIVWPVAGVLFPAVIAITNLFKKKG